MASENSKPTWWLIVVGNVVDGLEFHGPFGCKEIALEYGEKCSEDYGDWNLIDLIRVDKYESR